MARTIPIPSVLCAIVLIFSGFVSTQVYGIRNPGSLEIQRSVPMINDRPIIGKHFITIYSKLKSCVA